jgi:serine/threonine protein kinase
MSTKILDNFIALQVLGSGMFGTVREIESNEKKYALKIEKIRESALEIQNIMSTSFSEWREILFSQNFANTYQDQFITLLEYDIVDNCEYEYSEQYYNHLQYLPSHVIEKLQEKKLSTHCIRKVYSLINAPLKKYVKKIQNQKEHYSIFTQLIYICYLMQSNGYTHNDMHSNNIGVEKHDIIHTINIESILLNTYGYQIKLFDFGNVLHPSYKMTPEEEFQYKYNIKNEILRPISKFVTFEENEQMTKLIMWNENLEFFESWIKSESYLQFESPITIMEHNDHYDLTNTNKFSRYLAYQILFYDKFQKEYFGDKYIRTYEPIHAIQIRDYLYILNNIDNLHELVYYMIDKTNKN